MRIIYAALTYALLPVVFSYFWWRGRREPDYRTGWHQRLGYVKPPHQRAIWIHAASVGEVAMAEPLVRELAKAYPFHAIAITTFTPTGAERVHKRLSDIAQHYYLPLDTPTATRRFLHKLKPCCGIIMETELWPQLLAAAQHAQVPMILANANISQRSTKKYKKPWLKALMKPAIRSLTKIAASEPEHAQRFIDLGARADQVETVGNLKYEVQFSPKLTKQGAALRKSWGAKKRAVWIAASTHEDEEAVVLDAHRQLLAQQSDALLILAPRHPQRFAQVRELLDAQKWTYARFSQEEVVDETTQVVLGDTLGDVPLFYALADIAFVGGSLIATIGGHNILEPAALSRPVITGTHMQDWQAINDDMRQAGGLVNVADANELAQQLYTWFADAEQRQLAGQNAQVAYSERQGALPRLMALVSDIIN